MFHHLPNIVQGFIEATLLLQCIFVPRIEYIFILCSDCCLLIWSFQAYQYCFKAFLLFEHILRSVSADKFGDAEFTESSHLEIPRRRWDTTELSNKNHGDESLGVIRCSSLSFSFKVQRSPFHNANIAWTARFTSVMFLKSYPCGPITVQLKLWISKLTQYPSTGKACLMIARSRKGL